MSSAARDRWQVVSPHLDRALDMADDERGAWLEALRAEDPDLASEVEALLEERRALRREGFLENEAPRPPGASTLAGPDGSRQPTANELAIARFQGRHVATIARKLTGQ